ncbi:MAG: hypothetical protein EON98_12395 [Chitinophagaceae bacterium]|nr:MAG: hypothetical protein EON98_12395 [Chitinophagaceae bacterium]
MKRLILALAIVCLFSCSKEQTIQPIDGTWTIIETNTAESGYIEVQTYLPSSEVTLEFGSNGMLIRTGSNPGTAKCPLWEYDRYQLLEKNIVRFYQSAGNKEVKAYYTLEGNLFLNYLNMRHGYEEKFQKIK